MKKILSIMLILALALTGCAPAEQPIPEAPEATPEAAEPTPEAAEEFVPMEEEEEDNRNYPTLALDYDAGGRQYTFTAQTLDGQTVNSEEFFAQAKVTMVNVWATFCYPCLSEMPDLGRIAADYADKDFQVLGIIYDVTDPQSDTGLTAAEQIAETGANYTHVISSADMMKDVLFNVYAVPTTLFIDSEGKLICGAQTGSRAYVTWARAADELLAREAE